VERREGEGEGGSERIRREGEREKEGIEKE